MHPVVTKKKGKKKKTEKTNDETQSNKKEKITQQYTRGDNTFLRVEIIAVDK